MSASPRQRTGFDRSNGTEMSVGVNLAVESGMAQVEAALLDPKLTTLGRMNSVKQVLARYKSLNGKTMLERRRRAA